MGERGWGWGCGGGNLSSDVNTFLVVFTSDTVESEGKGKIEGEVKGKNFKTRGLVIKYNTIK